MDLADLKRYALAQREFSCTLGEVNAPRTITLRIPTHHETVLAARRSGLHTAGDDLASHIVLQRSLLLQAVCAWSGVLIGDVLPDHDDAAKPLVYEREAVELVLDSQKDWEVELGAQLLQRMANRREVKDTAAKN
jgi:hypothetical protein